MREPYDDRPPLREDRSNDWRVAAAFGVSILICLITFVWIFIELDPFMGDFTGRDVIVMPDATELADPGGLERDEGTPSPTQ